MKYLEFQELPYSYDFLAPVISKSDVETMYSHIYKGYVDSANKALETHPDLRFGCIDCLLGALSHVPKDIRSTIRNCGGGYKNYTLFWNILTSVNNSKFEGPIADAIVSTFDSYETFKIQFSAVANSHFGSGWVWLALNPDNTLSITSTHNQDNPIMEMQTAILGINLWEHAYYGTYQHRRHDYITNFFSIINWEKVNQIYEDTLRNPNRFGHE